MDNAFDFRLIVQISTFLVLFAALCILCYTRLIVGRFSSGMPGIMVLIVHVLIFYTFVMLDACDVFSVTEFVNNIVCEECVSFGLWSAAIRLQTAIELLLMVLTVSRRHLWIKKSAWR